MGQRTYWPSPMVVSYCAFEFGAIIRPCVHTCSLRHDSPCDNLYACVTYIHARKATQAKQNYLAGLATKKSGGTITHLHTWWQDGLPPQHIPSFKFPWIHLNFYDFCRNTLIFFFFFKFHVLGVPKQITNRKIAVS